MEHVNIVKKVAASVQQGVAKADGQVVLTDDTLDFTPYNEGLGLGPYTVALANITKVEKTSAKGAGILPLSNDAIRISCNDGSHLEFILANADEWVSLLTVSTH
jgi:hypothetical protein